MFYFYIAVEMITENFSNSADFSMDVPHRYQDGISTYKQETSVCNDRCPSQASSLCSSSGDICRICHCEGGPDLPLITPCYCSGSLRYVHQTCLQQWIKSSNIRNCELCKFQFIMQTKVKPFNEWEYLEMSGLERKKLLCAMLFHIIAMTCVCWSLYVLIDRTLDEVQKGHLEWPFWTKLIVVGIGFMGGIVFMYIQCKAYFVLCKRWKAYNRVIYVQNAPEKLTSQTANTISVEVCDKNVMEPSCSFKRTDAHKQNSDNLPETSCIGIKGVRNLHIFFGDENQIRLHRNDRLSKNPSFIQNERNVKCEEANTNVKTEKGNVTCGNTSLHIQIGNVDCARRNNDISYCNLYSNKLNESNSYGGAICPSDSNVNQSYDYEKLKCRSEFKNDQSVVKLQIKKAEIVIEFTENSDTDKCGIGETKISSRQFRNSNSIPKHRNSHVEAEAMNSTKQKFSSEEYLDFEKVADECNESPTSKLLILNAEVPNINYKDEFILKNWRSSENLVSSNKK